MKDRKSCYTVYYGESGSLVESLVNSLAVVCTVIEFNVVVHDGGGLLFIVLPIS